MFSSNYFSGNSINSIVNQIALFVIRIIPIAIRIVSFVIQIISIFLRFLNGTIRIAIRIICITKKGYRQFPYIDIKMISENDFFITALPIGFFIHINIITFTELCLKIFMKFPLHP